MICSMDFESLEHANEALQTRLNVTEETIAELRGKLAGYEQAQGDGLIGLFAGGGEEEVEQEDSEWSDLDGVEVESNTEYMYGDGVQAFDIYGDL